MSDRANEVAWQVVEAWPDGDLVPHEQLASDIAAALRAYAEEARREEPWTLVSDGQPPPHARYEVRRLATGAFVATPCYGMHSPWWVPLTADLYAPGAVTFPMENSDEWRPWTEATAIRAREETRC